MHPASRRVPCCNPPEVPACPGCMGHLSHGVVRILTVVVVGEWITRRRGGPERVLPQGSQEDAKSRNGRQRTRPATHRFPLLRSMRLLRLPPSAISAAPRETKGIGGGEWFTPRRRDRRGEAVWGVRRSFGPLGVTRWMDFLGFPAVSGGESARIEMLEAITNDV